MTIEKKVLSCSDFIWYYWLCCIIQTFIGFYTGFHDVLKYSNIILNLWMKSYGGTIQMKPALRQYFLMVLFIYQVVLTQLDFWIKPQSYHSSKSPSALLWCVTVVSYCCEKEFWDFFHFGKDVLSRLESPEIYSLDIVKQWKGGKSHAFASCIKYYKLAVISMHLFFETGAQAEVVYKKVIIVLILSKKRFKKPISSYINYYRGSFQRKFRAFLIEKDIFVRKREFCNVFWKYFNHDNSLTFYNISINLHYW